MSKRPEDLTLVLHVGLHKTATTYVQNVLSERREVLLDHGVLYPRTGTADTERLRTREGAQSGHILFTRPRRRRRLLEELLDEVPDHVSTVLLSSEDFTRPGRGPTPEQHLEVFARFAAVEVVLVVRRQDRWVESYYKQLVDQYARFEVRGFGDFLDQEGFDLLDFHTRFSPWRALVGAERFHLLSYDDLRDGAAICRRLLETAGLPGAAAQEVASAPVPRYDSVRGIDTLGLRLLNAYRLPDRDVRNRTARLVYDAAPAGDLQLATAGMRAAIRERCAPGNERIEAEWSRDSVPGFRFGADDDGDRAVAPEGSELVRYLDEVIALCEAARQATAATAEV